MTEVLWPLDMCPSSQTWNIIGNAATFTSPLSGATRTYGRPGARIGCTMTFPMMRGQDRARLVAFINTLLDRSNRAWVPDFSTTRRGSFSTSELLTNNDFSNGTTGWSEVNCSLSHANRVLRLTNTKAGGASSFHVHQTGLPVVQYAPYVMRGFISGLSRSGMMNGTFLDNTTNYAIDGAGMSAQAFVPRSTTTGGVYPAVIDGDGNVSMAGDYAELSYTSFSRCALVDGGGNLLTRSDEFDNEAWTKTRTTVTANAATAPDGSGTGDALIETATTGGHYIHQGFTVGASEADVTLVCAMRADSRTWGYLQLASATDAIAYFNLSTGATGTLVTGANWANVRAAVTSLGGGWYLCAITARKTDAATSLNAVVGMSTADNTVSYAGNGTSQIFIWRATVAVSSVPVRLTQSTSAAVSASSQTGTGIYIKGLPASTQGLLEAGDPVQIGGQINFLTARLDSDAAGRGYLQCGRPWLAATNDAPVIVHQPMCKMILATDTIDLDTGPGQFSPFQIELVEAIE